MTSNGSMKQSSITVSVRVRPFTEDEKVKLVDVLDRPIFQSDGQLLQSGVREFNSKTSSQETIRKIVNIVDEKMLIFDPPQTNPLISMQRELFPNPKFRTKIKDCRFVFDRLFDDDATQQEVYENTTKPLLDSILDGYNATVFAYGATGCGKTHTILGSPLDPGVIFLTLKELYERIDQLSNERIFDVSVLFLEIYNESIRDLLCPNTSSKMLNLREDSKSKMTVSNLLSHKPSDLEGIKQLIVVGNQNRTSSPTEANGASSRSHAVLQINVTLRHKSASLTEEHVFATLSIIDLAGSERAASTKNRGATLHEGANINKSLLALGNCINALCDPRRKNHVPYRDLKLTRLLKFSLGGNCKTVMIVCISPLSQHYDETLNTLKYADRVKEIKTKVIRNRHNLDRHVGSYLKMITEQKQEIEELKAREAKIAELEKLKAQTENIACIKSLMQHIASLQNIADRQVAEKRKKYYVLTKRKLLLLNINELDVLYSRINTWREQLCAMQGEVLDKCFQQIEILRNNFNDEIVYLEKLYNSCNEIEDALQRSKENSIKRLHEMRGWNDLHSKVYDALFEATEDRLQNDLLLNSSILFDFLVGKLNRFSLSLVAFCEFSSDTSNFDLGVRNDKRLEEVEKALLLMMSSEYDTEVNKLISGFIASKSRAENHEELNVVDRQSRFNFTEAETSHDKRANSSPTRNSPASKRAIRSPINARKMYLDMDITADMSGIVRDDDSPISDRINNSMMGPEDLVFEPVFNSPPMAKVLKNLEIQPPKLLSIDNTSNEDLINKNGDFVKLPLLNKKASSKVLTNLLLTSIDKDLNANENLDLV